MPTTLSVSTEIGFGHKYILYKWLKDSIKRKFHEDLGHLKIVRGKQNGICFCSFSSPFQWLWMFWPLLQLFNQFLHWELKQLKSWIFFRRHEALHTPKFPTTCNYFNDGCLMNRCSCCSSGEIIQNNLCFFAFPGSHSPALCASSGSALQ